MPIDFTQIQDVSDVEMLAILRQSLAQAIIRGNYSQNGRSIQSTDVAKLQSLIVSYEQRIQIASDAASGTPPNTSVVQFNQPV